MSVLTPLPIEKQAPDEPGSPSAKSAFTASQLIAALPGALRKLDPRQMWHNPVMFIGLVAATVVIVSALTYFPILALGPLAEGLQS